MLPDRRSPRSSQQVMLFQRQHTSSAERHEQSLIGIRGYCRQRSGEAVISEIAAATDPD
jgi:hypothetical protein